MGNWKFGDILSKATNVEQKAMFVAWDGAYLWIVMLYAATYALGETVCWVVGRDAWVLDE